MERAVTGLLSLATALPERERLASLDLRFWSMSALLALALDQQASKALRVLEFVGPRLEWTRYAPSSAHELGVEPGQATGEFRPGLTLGAALEFGRAPGIALVVEGTWLLRRTAYELKTTSGRERIGNSPRLVPTVALEVGFF
jgi:hypothetical protein